MKLKTYCLACRKHTNNSGSKKVMMTNTVIRAKSRCVICNNKKSEFFKAKKWLVILQNKDVDIMLKV